MRVLPNAQVRKPGLRLALYTKILLWFLVNLGVVAAIGLFYARVTFQPGLDWLLNGPPGSRIELLAMHLTNELMTSPQPDWDRVLKGYHAEKEVTFTLFTSDGRQVFGEQVEVAAEVRKQLTDKRQPGVRLKPPRPQGVEGAMMQPKKPRFLLRSESPKRYWSGMHLDLMFEADGQWHPLTMVLIADTLTANGLLFEWWPWIVVLLMGVGASALIWLPVVGGITRAIRRTNEASKRIAAGQFDVRLPDNRNDELGELSQSVNAMAAQLGDYVQAQKRITADVAHELCSPIARMQMALGVVEQRATPEQAGYLEKLDRELQHMARLVEEVMVFSKAETLGEREALETFSLRHLVEQGVLREAAEVELRVKVEEVEIRALREAVDRALGNVLRNAVRYAEEIEISAGLEGGAVVIQVRDRGPGVPEDSLKRLFEPFYRPELARQRKTGGSGLGLAIAKRCMEACGGTISATNREGGGLEVVMTLPMP
jgi:two-component system sensor histidine kinase CpxA